jgi:arginase family enzyme
MTDAPTFAMRSTFLAAQRSDADAAVAVAGIPLDLGVSYRAGTRFGPAHRRRRKFRDRARRFDQELRTDRKTGAAL